MRKTTTFSKHIVIDGQSNQLAIKHHIFRTLKMSFSVRLESGAIISEADLVREFHAAADDVEIKRSTIACVIQLAASNGWSRALRELRVGFGLGAGDARASDNLALQLAMQNGHIKVLRELREGFGLNGNDAEDVYDRVSNSFYEVPSRANLKRLLPVLEACIGNIFPGALNPIRIQERKSRKRIIAEWFEGVAMLEAEINQKEN